MSESLSPDQAYRAMYRFVEAYFERGDRRGRELTLFLSYARPDRYPLTADNPVGSGDPAAWSDWIHAIDAKSS